MVPVVADVGVTRWRGVYGTYRGPPLALSVAPAPPAACSDAGVGLGPGESSGWASCAADASWTLAPELRPIDVTGKSFPRFEVIAAAAVLMLVQTRRDLGCAS